MSPKDPEQVQSPARHVFSIEIAAPVQRVWNEITQRDTAQQAMFGTFLRTELRPGGPMAYTTANGRWRVVWGEVLEVQPPRRLVHTFSFAKMNEPPQRVTWELEDLGGRTRLVVTHEDLDRAPKTAKGVIGSWPTILERIRLLSVHGRLPLKDRLVVALTRLFTPLIAEKAA